MGYKTYKYLNRSLAQVNSVCFQYFRWDDKNLVRVLQAAYANELLAALDRNE